MLSSSSLAVAGKYYVAWHHCLLTLHISTDSWLSAVQERVMFARLDVEFGTEVDDVEWK